MLVEFVKTLFSQSKASKRRLNWDEAREALRTLMLDRLRASGAVADDGPTFESYCEEYELMLLELGFSMFDFCYFTESVSSKRPETTYRRMCRQLDEGGTVHQLLKTALFSPAARLSAHEPA